MELRAISFSVTAPQQLLKLET